jgi:hypothetical protein
MAPDPSSASPPTPEPQWSLDQRRFGEQYADPATRGVASGSSEFDPQIEREREWRTADGDPEPPKYGA